MVKESMVSFGNLVEIALSATFDIDKQLNDCGMAATCQLNSPTDKRKGTQTHPLLTI
jgi:hypothetical protein